MCNLSEAIWEKAVAKGEFIQIMRTFDKLMSKGFEFDEVVDLLDISPETADKVRKNLTSKAVLD